MTVVDRPSRAASSTRTRNPANVPPRSRRRQRVAVEAAPRLFDGSGLGERTLDDVVGQAWEGIAESRAVDCLVCGSPMAFTADAHHEPHGSCTSCGAVLS